MSDVTRILNSIEAGDPKAADELLPVVYGELRRLAAAKMAAQPPGQTIQATALVHEAFIKLSGGGERRWKNSRHFFAAAAEAMRSILIDRVRRKRAARRGGGKQDLPLDGIEIQIESSTDQETLLMVNEALDQLVAEDPMKAQVVKLRFFVGLSNQEIAEILDVTTRTVERAWAYARAWLFRSLKGDGGKT